ncbi:MAG: hypothetical protein WCF98_04110 [Synechococcus sp. ELA057]
MGARLQLLAALLSWLPSVEPLGLRGGADSIAICLLSPAANRDPQGVVRAVTPVADPTIFARGTFEEIRLERDGQVVWRLLSDGSNPIAGPLVWPLSPLRPGERLLLRLRPEGIGQDNFANVELIGGSSATLARSAQLRRSLGRDPAAWTRAVLSALDASRSAEALALLYDARGPSSPRLNALRLEIHNRACDSTILGPDRSGP